MHEHPRRLGSPYAGVGPAWLGIAVAGGLYPLALVILETAVRTSLGWRPALPTTSAAGLLLLLLTSGFAIGFLYAGVYAACVLAAVLGIGILCGGAPFTTRSARISGGLTGCFCAMTLIDPSTPTYVLAPATAALMGEVGALSAIRWLLISRTIVSPTRPARFSLRAALVVMSVACLAAAVAASLDLGWRAGKALALALAAHCGLSALLYVWRRSGSGSELP